MATQELPVTPEISAMLRRHRAQQRRLYGILAACGAGFFPAIFALVAWDDLKKGDWKLFLEVSPLMAAGFVVMLGCIYFFSRGLPLGRDLRERSYLRTSGPVQGVTMFNGSLLRLVDRAFILYQKPVVKALQNVPWATVDYSRHAHVIFEVRDRSGRNVFRM
jgi:hypothetical protein